MMTDNAEIRDETDKKLRTLERGVQALLGSIRTAISCHEENECQGAIESLREAQIDCVTISKIIGSVLLHGINQNEYCPHGQNPEKTA